MSYILILSLVLRLILINQSLWLDEAIQALALEGHFGPLLSYSLSDFQPPLYHLILKFWTSIVGYSEISLRLPSILSGTFTVYFVVKIAELIGNRQVGVIAGLLTATNPLLIYYSQEGRTYAMTTFLVTASFYYFIQLLIKKTRSSYLLYSIFSVLFIWTSYLSWFVLLSQGIYVISKKRWDLVAIQLISAATLLFWLPSFFQSLRIGMVDAQMVPGWGKVVGGTSLKALALTWVKANIGRISFTNQWLYSTIVLMLAGLHFHILRKSRQLIISHQTLFLWITIPVVLGSLISLWVPAYSYTRVLFIVPAYILVLALGLSRLPRFYISTVLSLNLLFLATFWFNPRFHREDWRSLASNIPAEAALAMPSRAQSAPMRYYGWTSPIIEPSHEPLNGNQIYYLRYAEDLFDLSRLGHANFISSGYTIRGEASHPGIQVVIYEK